MWWIAGGAAGWLAGAVVLSIGIGQAIRYADRRAGCRPYPEAG